MVITRLVQVSCGAAPTGRKVIDGSVHTCPNVDFIQSYGMTESRAVRTRGFNIGKLYNYTSVGLLAPNTQAKVVDCTTSSCSSPGKAGELWLRGPSIMKGYLNDREATRSATEEGGWLCTGDLVYFDNDGCLYIVDRIKDMIKYKGIQIAPTDLEAILMKHPYILDAAVASAADETAGEVPDIYSIDFSI